jgi:hypothetical protein
MSGSPEKPLGNKRRGEVRREVEEKIGGEAIE